MEKKHALLNPSSAIFWMNCPHWVYLKALQVKKESPPNKYMLEGIKKHEHFASISVREIYDKLLSPAFPQMKLDDPLLKIFQELEIKSLVGGIKRPLFYGTIDLAARCGECYVVIDYKSGYQEVEVEGNLQLHCYMILFLESQGIDVRNDTIKIPLHIGIYQNNRLTHCEADQSLFYRILNQIDYYSDITMLADMRTSKCKYQEICDNCLYLGSHCEGCIPTAITTLAMGHGEPRDLTERGLDIRHVLKWKPQLIKWLDKIEDLAKEKLTEDPNFFGGDITLSKGYHKYRWKENTPAEVLQLFYESKVKSPTKKDLDVYSEWIEPYIVARTIRVCDESIARIDSTKYITKGEHNENREDDDNTRSS
jgi:hypothetical protein